MSCMIAGIRLMCKLNFPMDGDGLQPGGSPSPMDALEGGRKRCGNQEAWHPREGAMGAPFMGTLLSAAAACPGGSPGQAAQGYAALAFFFFFSSQESSTSSSTAPSTTPAPTLKMVSSLSMAFSLVWLSMAAAAATASA